MAEAFQHVSIKNPISAFRITLCFCETAPCRHAFPLFIFTQLTGSELIANLQM